jgi:RND family efflux transporter MFP subunit
VAPFDGIVGIVQVEPGDYVTTQSQIVTLDDRSQILVDFWVPERFAGAIKSGQPVEAIAIALPGKVFFGSVAAVASRIDRESRTLQVRAKFDNGRDELRPGMSFKVTMKFAGDSFPAVDPLAIQWSSSGAYVWKEQGGVAVKTPVRIVQRNSDWVLVDGQLTSGEPLVIEGVQSLREGTRIRVAGDKPRAAGS